MESNLSGHKTYPDSGGKVVRRTLQETISSPLTESCGQDTLENLSMIKGLLLGRVIIG